MDAGSPPHAASGMTKRVVPPRPFPWARSAGFGESSRWPPVLGVECPKKRKALKCDLHIRSLACGGSFCPHPHPVTPDAASGGVRHDEKGSATRRSSMGSFRRVCPLRPMAPYGGRDTRKALPHDARHPNPRVAWSRAAWCLPFPNDRDDELYANHGADDGKIGPAGQGAEGLVHSLGGQQRQKEAAKKHGEDEDYLCQYKWPSVFCRPAPLPWARSAGFLETVRWPPLQGLDPLKRRKDPLCHPQI